MRDGERSDREGVGVREAPNTRIRCKGIWR